MDPATVLIDTDQPASTRSHLLGYALMVNSLTILEHQARSGRSPDLLAAYANQR